VSEPSPRETVERFARALATKDLELARSALAEDVVEEYPQSGERFRGLDNWIEVQLHYPEYERLSTNMESVEGAEDRWVAGPNWSLMRIEGTSDRFWGAGQVHYPNGSTWHIVSLFQLRDGKIAHITTYFAEPFPAAEWRRPWWEPMA
jgi:ketosteroid isomerase-like protein